MKNSTYILISILMICLIGVFKELKDVHLLSITLLNCTLWIVKQMEDTNGTKQ